MRYQDYAHVLVHAIRGGPFQVPMKKIVLYQDQKGVPPVKELRFEPSYRSGGHAALSALREGA